MKNLYLFFALLSFPFIAGAQKPDILYQVSQRNFFDSNGDGLGDLKGVQQKLDYLEQLGVTAIVLSPLYQSGYSHNYFADDFEKIDPSFGGLKEYRDLVLEVHRRKMKVYQEIEMQYVSRKHAWFTGSFNNPSSKYSKYIIYTDKANRQPYFYAATPMLKDNTALKDEIAVVNLKEPAVKEYISKTLKYWLDPNGDSLLNDGADGYKFNGLADNTGSDGRMKNLLNDFWAPVMADLRKANPALRFFAEPAARETSFSSYFTAGIDGLYAYEPAKALASFSKNTLAAAAEAAFNQVPEGKNVIVMAENDDMPRIASAQGTNEQKLKIAAALNLFLGAVPSIQYGQELGIKAAATPVNEPFPWYAPGKGTGMVTWNTGASPETVTAEDQAADPQSLLNYYRQLIKLRKTDPGFMAGSYKETPNSGENVFSFLRIYKNLATLVVINLSGNEETAILADNSLKLSSAKLLLGDRVDNFKNGSRAVVMPPYAVQVWRMNYVPRHTE
ncbi:hypothetical protein CHU92_03580 [Flavobacterium cyanobacteriorum]|uniref:Glycosyl hydrolase family 13 catalytic domain-containing protein n=1 Tax=Flavobacterium cyanobacteriorum TaxID=2022802 RepID=A0A255ZPF6_9FLAO|nr:alpha-amylase family glycosyl hydrolase [Flavobacterium cyanobacteriorum]OYQ43289.1 hypothetical protein CHU92_03580 [Flavobacterium cyanobacteriorum]